MRRHGAMIRVHDFQIVKCQWPETLRGTNFPFANLRHMARRVVSHMETKIALWPRYPLWGRVFLRDMPMFGADPSKFRTIIVNNGETSAVGLFPIGQSGMASEPQFCHV